MAPSIDEYGRGSLLISVSRLESLQLPKNGKQMLGNPPRIISTLGPAHRVTVGEIVSEGFDLSQSAHGVSTAVSYLVIPAS